MIDFSYLLCYSEIKQANTNMRTSTIDYSPVTPERSDVAPATAHAIGERAVVHTHEQHEIDLDALRAKFATVSNSVRKNTPINYNYPTLAKGNPRVREDMLWRQHKWVEEPLMQLWEEYTDVGQPFGDFVSTVVGVRPNQELTKSQKQYKSVIMASIRHGVAVRQVRSLFDEHDVQYELPDEAAVRSGADLIIGGRSYRFKTMQGATSLISAEVPGTYRRTLPSPFLSELPADYQIPPYTSNKVISGILSSFGVPATKTATRENTPPTPTRQDTIVTSSTDPAPKKPAAPVASTAKRKRPGRAERQAAHQRLLAEHAAAKATRQALAEKRRVLEKQKARDRRVARAAAKPTTLKPAISKQIISQYERQDTIVSLPDHAIGLTKEHLLPNDTNESVTLRGEEYFLAVISQYLHQLESIESNPDSLPRRIDSIAPDDPDHIIALKKIGYCMLRRDFDDNSVIMAIDIPALNGKIRASELREFMMLVRDWGFPAATSHGVKRAAKSAQKAMNILSGFRVEESVKKLARMSGREVIDASREQDKLGIDMFIDGVPFDTKSSHTIAVLHTQRYARNVNRYHTVKFVPPFTAKDFQDQLVIPDDQAARLLETTDFNEMIDEAVARYLQIDLPADDLADRDAKDTADADYRTYERSKHQQAYDEIEALAVNATRLQALRRRKAAATKWGDNA